MSLESRMRQRRPLARRAHLLAGIVMLAGSALLAGCRSSPEGDDVVRVRAHIETLAGRIGPRPTGSTSAARARDYIAGELRAMGFEVRIQEADAVDERAGLTVRVANVIGIKAGATEDAIALVSHYDSHPEAPGALDDALGVAVSLEAARQITGAPLGASLFVIATDAEELGLMGARAVATDPEVRARVRAFLNFDGTGASGPALLFEAGPGWGAPLSAWAAGAAAPEGGSFSTEIYRRLPNDTDFSVLKDIGASGLNFAPIGDAYAYHTDRDLPARIQAFTIHHDVINAVSTVRALDARSGPNRGDTPTYFPVFGRAVVYGATVTQAVAIVAIVVGVFAWLRLAVEGHRARGLSGLVLTVVWSVLGVGAAAAAMVGAVWLLRESRAELHPWYAAPHWFLSWLAVSGLAAAALVARLGRLVPDRLRPWRGPAAVWWTTLPVWVAMTVALLVAAPVASYLMAWPLAIAAILVGAGAPRAWIVRTASLVALAAVATLWIANVLRLLAFTVALFGWLPIVTPLVLYPAMLLAAGLVLLPPIVALVARQAARDALPKPAGTEVEPSRPATSRSSMRIGYASVAAFVILGALAWLAPAYTWDRPHRRVVRYVQDDVGAQAWWEVGGNEDGPGLGMGAPEAWERAVGDLPATAPVGAVNTPFRFRARVEPETAPPPGDVASSLTIDPEGRARLEVTIVPHALTAARLVLPEGVRPATSSLAGVVRGGRWMAAYAAVPAAGLTIHLTFGGLDPSLLGGAVVVFTVAAVPGSTGGSVLPAWLPTADATWLVRSTRIVSAGPPPISR